MKTLVILALALLVGCANQTPIQKAYADQTLYNSSLSSLIALRRAGVIKDAQYKDIEKVRAIADLAIQVEVHDALAGKSNDSSGAALDAFLAEILKTNTPGGK